MNSRSVASVSIVHISILIMVMEKSSSFSICSEMSDHRKSEQVHSHLADLAEGDEVKDAPSAVLADTNHSS